MHNGTNNITSQIVNNTNIDFNLSKLYDIDNSLNIKNYMLANVASKLFGKNKRSENMKLLKSKFISPADIPISYKSLIDLNNINRIEHSSFAVINKKCKIILNNYKINMIKLFN
jgi:hypothetical protein